MVQNFKYGSCKGEVVHYIWPVQAQNDIHRFIWSHRVSQLCRGDAESLATCMHPHSFHHWCLPSVVGRVVADCVSNSQRLKVLSCGTCAISVLGFLSFARLRNLLAKGIQILVLIEGTCAGGPVSYFALLLGSHGCTTYH